MATLRARRAGSPAGRPPRSLPWRPIALAAVLLWLTGYPLLTTLLEALQGPDGPTVAPFRAFFVRPDEWLALWRSLWISGASVALAAAVGIPLGFLFERADFPGRRLLGALVALPVALPPLVGVIAFLFLYGESGFLTRAVQETLGLDAAPWRLQGAGAILLVHTYSFYVYFYLFTRAGLSRLDAALPEAAASLGAAPGRTFRKVTLPLLRPALVGAALLVFMTSLASFSAPYIFGGGFRVMTTQITASKLNGELAMAQAETVLLALVALVGLWLFQKLGGATSAAGVRGIAPARRRLGGPVAQAVAAAAGYLLAVFLLLPHLTLLLISFVPPFTWTTEMLPPELSLSNYTDVLGSARNLEPVIQSLWMAAVATVAALVLGFVTARAAVRRSGTRLGRFLETLISLPWAIPGTVFALALATTFNVHQPWFGRFVLVGTPLLLPLAYLIRNLPLTGRAALSGLGQVDPALEEAAASLGASRWRTVRKVVVPLVRPALAAGAGLAFITALGDFVTSILLYTPYNRPISMEILSRLGRQELGAAAVYGVVLMIASTLAFVAWGRGETA